MTLQGLQRVQRIPNSNYKRSGPKSYAWLLQKWGFTPTLEGPYFQMQKTATSEHHRILDKITRESKGETYQVLAKKAPAGSTAEPGEVTAEDVQIDSMYLCVCLSSNLATFY
jgi:hypothetical protein